MSALVLLLLGISACTEEPDALLSPNDPSAYNSCETQIIPDPECEEQGYTGAVVQFDEDGQYHNEGLAFDLTAIMDTVNLYGPISSDRATEIAKAYTEDYLDNDPLIDWQGTADARNRYFAGEDIVAAYYPSGWSSTGKQLFYTLFDVLGKAPAELQDTAASVRDRADWLLSGDEREALIAAAGILSYSAQYWDSNLTHWTDGIQNASASLSCRDKAIMADMTGAMWGSLGGPKMVIIGAVVASTLGWIYCMS